MDDQKTSIEHDKSSLPEEIITFEIFSRLAVKSLYQFRCVSKLFRSLTTQDSFLDAYRRRLRHRYVLSFRSSLHWDSVFYSIEPDSVGKARATPINQLTNLHYNTYAQSINGFACISRNRDISICQVATKEILSLRKIPSCDESERQAQHIYFCYDPNSARYKVLRLVSTLNDVFQVTSTRYWIFTIGQVMSWWKLIPSPNLYILRKGKSVCINGILYCTNFSTTSEVDNGVIACFDVAHEYFKTRSYPEGLPSSRYTSCHIIELNGSLCAIDIGDLMKSCFMTMWVYNSKDYNHQTWMKYRIEFPSCWKTMVHQLHNCSFCSDSHGEIVVAVSGISTVGLCILIYGVETKKWRKFEVSGLAEHTIMGDFLVEYYVESPRLLSNIFQP